MHPIRQRRPNRGFTLIELLVVLAILAMLAGVVGPKVFNALSTSKDKTAKVQIENLASAVEMYYLDVGKYPGSLDNLVTSGGGKNWNGPYLAKAKVPADPWGNPYQFKAPGDHGPFDIWSQGGEGADGKINNWE